MRTFAQPTTDGKNPEQVVGVCYLHGSFYCRGCYEDHMRVEHDRDVRVPAGERETA